MSVVWRILPDHWVKVMHWLLEPLSQSVLWLHVLAQKGVKTVKGEYMAFGTFYDSENHFFDTTNFSQSIKKYPFAGRGVYLIEGKVVDEFGFCSLEVIKMARLAPKPDPRY